MKVQKRLNKLYSAFGLRSRADEGEHSSAHAPMFDIPPPVIQVSPGPRETGLTSIAEFSARFPVPASVMFAFLSHPARHIAMRDICELRREEVPADCAATAAAGGTNTDDSVASTNGLCAYQETMVGEIPLVVYRKQFVTRFHVEEDTSDPRVMVQRCRLLHGDLVYRFEGSCTVEQEEEEEEEEAQEGVDAEQHDAQQKTVWCKVTGRHGITPKVPEFLRSMTSSLLRSALETEKLHWHEDLCAMVRKVLSGASVDEAIAAYREERLAAAR